MSPKDNIFYKKHKKLVDFLKKTAIIKMYFNDYLINRGLRIEE